MLLYEKIRELRFERKKVFEQLEAITKRAIAERRDLTPEERSQSSELEERIKDLTAQIELLERQLDLGTLVSGKAPTPAAQASSTGGEEVRADYLPSWPQYRSAWRKWSAYGMGSLSDEERDLLLKGSVEARALGVSTDAAGGFLVPMSVQREIEQRMITTGRVLSIVRRIQTATGEPLRWPKVDDTGASAMIIAENGQIVDQDVAFNAIELSAYTYSSGLIRVSNALLQDSAFDIEQFLIEVLAARFARALENHVLYGTGSGEPQGIIPALPASQIHTGATGQTTSITYDDLVTVISKLDPAYRDNARFVVHPTMEATLMRLTDGNGRPIWVDMADGRPPRLLGYEVVLSVHMPEPGAGNVSLLFGDFSKYILRQAAGFTVIRAAERYVDFLQTAFLGVARFDGAPIQEYAFAAYQNSAS